MSRRQLLREWVPPGARRWVNRALGANLRYRGPYADFAEAAARTRGYGDAAIVREVERATREVLAGRASYQQDGVAFDGAPPASESLAALLLAAARNGGRLELLDFGGSLASHFLRWRGLLAPLPALHWCVVEQEGFVAAGRALFASEASVSFEASVQDAARRRPNAVFASSVLQYLPEPEAMLSELAALGADMIIIDRFPRLAPGAATSVLSQHLPRRAGGASYPLRAFASDWLESQLQPRYRCVANYAAADAPIQLPGLHADYVGSAWAASDAR